VLTTIRRFQMVTQHNLGLRFHRRPPASKDRTAARTQARVITQRFVSPETVEECPPAVAKFVKKPIRDSAARIQVRDAVHSAKIINASTVKPHGNLKHDTYYRGKR
jgi:hypothetical protein